jgi:multimeric flavodoxin WrbA
MLLRQALTGAESASAKADYIRLPDYHIGPCTECNECFSTGQCCVQDDYLQVLKKILAADRLIFATPVFFMSVSAQAKTLIDRGQCLWVYKHILKKRLFTPERDRRAMVIAVGGSKSKKQFESIRLTMMSYFDALQVHYESNLFVSRIEGPGDIQRHPSALKEAYRLGQQLATPDAPLSEEPIVVELT